MHLGCARSARCRPCRRRLGVAAMISIGKVRSADYYLGAVERNDASGYYADVDGDSHHVEDLVVAG